MNTYEIYGVSGGYVVGCNRREFVGPDNFWSRTPSTATPFRDRGAADARLAQLEDSEPQRRRRVEWN